MLSRGASRFTVQLQPLSILHANQRKQPADARIWLYFSFATSLFPITLVKNVQRLKEDCPKNKEQVKMGVITEANHSVIIDSGQNT